MTAIGVAVGVVVFAASRSGPEPERLSAAGETYAVVVELDAAMTEASIRVDPAADAVELSAVMPEMGHSTPLVPARRVAPGRFEARGDFFSMAGIWDLAVRVTGPAGAETITLPVLVDDQGARR